MKQFIVLCAVLPLLLIIMLQMTLDQISNYRITALNQVVYAAKERAQQEGYFTDEIKDDLYNQLVEIGFDSSEIETEYDDYAEPQQIGSILNYMIKVRVDKAMIGFMAGDSGYDYLIDSCTVSQYVVIP